ncbi:serine/threonine-protein kinase [Streptomyces sp. NBC_00259]|uniref:serine/threonine-protein kinase n=1 Tax=Streptomyces sp. NBC_00259 TaxID=2903643 RepID=UPI002E2B8D3C|nr:serine/threonine-protein kinase [Streptomyces sp. NBC_00259]
MHNKEAAQVPPDQERRVAGRYLLLSRLGEGGMGTVWRARDETLHRDVAVKEVRAPAGMSAAHIERMYTRLEREAWAAARIPNRNVVTVYDVATDDGRPWIVMELVRGRSLGDLLRAEGPLTPKRAARIGAEVLSALRAAHGEGVLHRDVKPANVLLGDDGSVVLTDFGIAMVEGDSSLTMTGEVVGSPEYLPPERALGRTPGPESDLWSLGVLLYAAVEGLSPFRQDTPLSTLRAIVDEEARAPRLAGPLTPVIERLLRKEPTERMTAEQAERDLRSIASGDTDRTAPASPAVATAAAEAPTSADLEAPTADALESPTAADTSTVGDAATMGDAPTPGDTPTAHTVPGTSPDQPVRAPEPAQTVQSAEPAQPSQPSQPSPSAPAPSATLPHAPAAAGASAATTPPGVFGPPVPFEPPPADVPPRRRRTAAVIAGAVACALLIAGLSYALVNHGHDEGGNDKAAGTNGSSQDTGATPGAGSSPSQAEQDASASQQVRVTVTGVNTTYVGACSPPADRAPTFTATFAVDQVPARITYRWVSKDGSVVDRKWRSLTFPGDGDRTGQDVVRLTAYSKAGTFTSEIGVEVKGPLGTTSNTVPFSVTCE